MHDGDITIKLYNPVASYQVIQYRKQILDAKEQFTTIPIASGLLSVDCNYLTSLAKLGDITPDLMDILLSMLIERDQFLCDQYYRIHCSDKDKQGNSCYRPLKRSVFLGSDISFGENMIGSIHMTSTQFLSDTRFVVKPLKTGSQWHLHILDIANGQPRWHNNR